MKKITLLLTGLLISIISFGQCKWKTDPISGTKQFESKEVKIIRFSKAIRIIVSHKEGVSYIKSILPTGIVSDDTFNNPKLEVRLKDGNLLTFVPSDASGQLYGTSYRVTFISPIEPGDIVKLSQSPATAIRMSFNAIEELFELKGKEGDKIMEYADCIVQQ